MDSNERKKRDEFDRVIGEQFGKSLNFYEASSIDDIICGKDVSELIEAVICLNQFPRHT